jgi:hypothetical protein
MIEGELEHQDRTGNQAVVRVGKVQRMIAGTGIVHIENTVIKLKYFILHIYSQKSLVCNRGASNIVHTSFFMCATAATCSAHTQRQTSSACPAFVC